MSGLTFMFRGQSDASWPIQTTLYRRYKLLWHDRDCWNEYVEEYESKKRNIISRDILNYKPTQENEDFYILSTLRHLGFPCHLIDWTASLTTAIFFACSEKENEDGALWILSTNQRINTSPITVSPFQIEQPLLICKEFDLIPLGKSILNLPKGRIRRFRQNGFMSIIPQNYISKDFEYLLNDDYSLQKVTISCILKKRVLEYLNRDGKLSKYIMADISNSINF